MGLFLFLSYQQTQNLLHFQIIPMENKTYKGFVNDISLNTTKANSFSKNYIQVAQIERVQTFRSNTGPNITSEKRKQIQEQLSIQEKVKIRYLQRMITDDLYLQYDTNPFVVTQPHQQKAIQIKRLEPKRQPKFGQEQEQEQKQANNKQEKKVSIIAAINNLSVMNAQRKIMASTLEETLAQRNHVLKNNTYRFRENDDLELFKDNRKLIAEKTVQKQNNSSHFPDALDLDSIIKINQKSFYSEQKIGNIFHYRKKKQSELKNGTCILEDHNFCYSLTGEMLNKSTNIFYRHISKFARSMMLDLPFKQDKSDYLETSEINHNAQPVDFILIVSIATGRKTPEECLFDSQEINQMDKQEEKNGNIKEVVEQRQIYYQQGTDNQLSNIKDYYEEIVQIKEFMHMSLSAIEKNYVEELSKTYHSLSKILQQEKYVIAMNILDMGLIKKINQVKNYLVKKQFLLTEDPDRDRQIRKKKAFKNKEQNMKIKHLKVINSTVMEHQKMIQISDRKRNMESKNVTEKRPLYGKKKDYQAAKTQRKVK